MQRHIIVTGIPASGKSTIGRAIADALGMPMLSLPGVVVEIHCVCGPHIAAERFLSRTRHAGHLDHWKTQEELMASFQQHAVLGPLGLGQVVLINTEQALDLKDLLAEIETAMEAGGDEIG